MHGTVFFFIKFAPKTLLRLHITLNTIDSIRRENLAGEATIRIANGRRGGENGFNAAVGGNLKKGETDVGSESATVVWSAETGECPTEAVQQLQRGRRTIFNLNTYSEYVQFSVYLNNHIHKALRGSLTIHIIN